ncbi:MAG: prefoldin subunit alpha [Candidatus Woesearchaeota archaeon]
MKYDKRLKEKYETLKRYEEHVRELNKEIGKIQERSSEIELIIQSLETLKSSSKDKDALFPLSNGIFIRGRLNDDDKVLMNVGNNTVVEKKIDEAKEMLSEQLKELEEYNEDIINNMAKIDEKAYAIQEEIFGIRDDKAIDQGEQSNEHR